MDCDGSEPVVSAPCDAGGVTHCLLVGSSVRPRAAQDSCVGCIAVVKPPIPDVPGRAQAVSINAEGTMKYFTTHPEESARASSAARLSSESYS
jgi:hypothetical protein